MAEIALEHDVLLGLELDLYDQDPNECAHMFRFPNGSARKGIDYAIEHRLELTALCGERRVPTRHGEELPACRRCVAVWQEVSSDG